MGLGAGFDTLAWVGFVVLMIGLISARTAGLSEAVSGGEWKDNMKHTRLATWMVVGLALIETVWATGASYAAWALST
jgi:hypothetical protein